MDYGPYIAIVRDMHDGDTIGLDIDLGFKHSILASNPVTGKREFTCRFFGINAPELSTELGKEALAFLKTLVTVGDTVTVVSKDWDAYQGRYDAIVTKVGQTTSLNDLMVESGHAARL